MQLATVFPAPDGSTVTFSVTPTPISADHAFVFVQTQWLTRVTSSPGAGEYTLSGSTVTLGQAPKTGDSLRVYVESSTSKMLVLEDLSSQITGAASSFVIATPIQTESTEGVFEEGVFDEGVFDEDEGSSVVSSEPIVVLNTRVLSLVSSAPGFLEYTRSGQTITLGMTPRVGDSFHVLCQADKLTGATFAKQTITGPQDSESRFFRLSLPVAEGYSHLTLINQGGRMLLPDASIPPEPGRHAYDSASGVIEVFTPPGPTDSFHAWVVGTSVTVQSAFVTWLLSQQPGIYFADVGNVKLPLGFGEEPFGVEVGEKQTSYYATEPYTTAATDDPANLTYEGFIRSISTITRSMRSAFGDNSLVTYSSLLLNNESTEGTQKGKLDTTYGIAGWATDGQPFSLSYGGKAGALAFADRATVIRGTSKIQICSRSTVEIPLNDDSGQLLRPIAMQQLTRDEFPHLPEESIGAVKPDVYGYVWNLAPTLIDEATHTYNTSRLPIAGVDAVFDNGIPVQFSFDTVRRDRFSLVATPTGQITCDLRGYEPIGRQRFSARIGDVLEDYFRRFPGYSVTQIDYTWLRLFKYEAPWDVGLVIKEPTAPKDILDKLLAGFPCAYYFTRTGKFVVKFLGTISNRIPQQRFVAELDSLESDPPLTYTQRLKRVSLGYAKNETVQNSLSTAMTADQRAFVQNEYRVVQHYDGAVGTLFPESLDEEQINTCISNRTDAQALAVKRLSFFRTVHPLITETFQTIPLLLDLGAEVTYSSQYLRYQLGQYTDTWIITRMVEQHLIGVGGTTKVTLSLMQ